MPKKEYPHEYTDAQGNTVIHHKDGTSEMYIGGKDSADKWLDVSNEADKAVFRTRYLPDVPAAPRPDLHTRDEAMPGNDDLDDEDASD